jgi:hypothetical protein
VILAAGLLVLLGLALFVAGLLTGVAALYWACVGACAVAAVLLILARRRIRRALAGDEAVRAPAEGPSAPAATGSPERVEAAPPAETPASAPPPAPRRGAAGSDATAASAAPEEGLGEPPAEEVEVTDLLLVLDLKDEVLVVDEHPRYHLGGCRYVAGRSTFPLPLDEARTDGFTPCGACEPDRHLAEKVRARKQAGDS